MKRTILAILAVAALATLSGCNTSKGLFSGMAADTHAAGQVVFGLPGAPLEATYDIHPYVGVPVPMPPMAPQNAELPGKGDHGKIRIMAQ